MKKEKVYFLKLNANISRKIKQVKVKPCGFAEKISTLAGSIFSQNLDLVYLSSLTSSYQLQKNKEKNNYMSNKMCQLFLGRDRLTRHLLLRVR